MKDFIIKYYGRMRDYLLEANTEDVDVGSIAFEVDRLKEEFYNETDEDVFSTDSEYEEQNAVWGLFKKFDRLHGNDSNFVVRDPESLLAKKLDLGLGTYVPPCPFSEEDFPKIQKIIINHIIKRAKTAEDENSKPLLKGVAQSELSREQMNYIVDKITRISHTLTDYVDNYDDGSWNWQVDCRFIVQYVFEKVAELTYKVAMGETPDEPEYDIREAFSYFQLSVPDNFQMKLDSEVDKLDSIVLDITDFIEKNDYHLCNKLTWFYPMIYNAALNGMFYTLEQDLQNSHE
jgi:hypothetical protein